MRLLNTNAKLSKPVRGYSITGLTIAPHSLGGWNACEDATDGCRAACVLWFAGRSNTPSVRAAMIRRKQFFVSDPAEFTAYLLDDIARFAVSCRKAETKPAVRLNVASDLDWRYVAEEFPNVAFYDYSKVRSRFADATWPSNYQLTYSWHEKANPEFGANVMRTGANVAMVFDVRYVPQHRQYGKLPRSVIVDGQEFRVVDGDRNDLRLRHFDGSGVVVGLRLKGTTASRARAVASGFAVTPQLQQVGDRIDCGSTGEVIESGRLLQCAR